MSTNRTKKTVTTNGTKIFDVIRRPIVTEKSTMAGSDNRYTFEVSADATKPEIKAAVENLFKVKVENVNTLTQKGKEKRFRGVKGQRSNVRKAVVRLAQGQTIDAAAGV